MNRVRKEVPPVPRTSRRRSPTKESRLAPPALTMKPKHVSAPPVAPDIQSQLELRIRDVLRREISFIHSPEFNLRSAQHEILDEVYVQTERPTPHHVPGARDHGGLPAYFASLYEHELLTPDQQNMLFRRMNYLKFRANAIRSALTPHTACESAVDEIEGLLADAQKTRDQIISANLRLAVSLSRKYAGSTLTFDDLLSDGNLALIRAIEKFDYTRGFRFSTYATHAIQRDFFRLLNREQKHDARIESGVDELADGSEEGVDEDIRATEEYRRYTTLLQAMHDQLDDRERQILMMRCGIDQADGPLTLETIGQRLRLSKERIRQLEIRAIGKLKRHVEGNR